MSMIGEAASSLGTGKGQEPTPSSLGPLALMPRLAAQAALLIASLLVTFLGLTAVTFFIGRFIPTDPVLAVVGDRATREVYDKAQIAMGLDRSILEQYVIYLKKVLAGDLGHSVITSHPVLADLMHFFPATFELATIATVIGVAVGVPAGVLAAAPAGTRPRPRGARGRPPRLFDAGVLARSRRPLPVLRQARLGGRPRAYRCLLRGRARRHAPASS